MKIELQRLVDGIWYVYGNYDMSKTHDATAFDEAVSELAKHFDIRTVVSYTDVEKQGEGLEDKIADIKANCDLAIEGRDVKIMELEQENNKLLDVINNQDVKIADLEKQIEKMKCCQNCKNLLSLEYGEFSCNLYGECKHCSKWEIKEND